MRNSILHSILFLLVVSNSILCEQRSFREKGNGLRYLALEIPTRSAKASRKKTAGLCSSLSCSKTKASRSKRRRSSPRTGAGPRMLPAAMDTAKPQGPTRW